MNTPRLLSASFALFAALAGCAAGAAEPTTAPAPQAGPETPAEHDARMAWWREARFGMFVHWGLYSGLADTWNGKPNAGKEWLQARSGVDTDTYAKAAKPLFTPKPGFAKAWARLAKAAGCKYVVFTTKHHDGFALHDSKVSDYDAKDFTGRDLVKEITDALHEEGLKVGFYHSLVDWHHPDYDYKQAVGLPFNKAIARNDGAHVRDQSKYIPYLHAQVEELMSNYGKVDIAWWDFSSPTFYGDKAWGASELVKKVRAKQPGIIMNNRLSSRLKNGQFPLPGDEKAEPGKDGPYGDFKTPEQFIPETGLGKVDWESCMTINESWGFSAHDHKWKSTQTLVRNLVDLASKGGNYLLNIGPTGDGTVPPEAIERMEGIGAWLRKNGEAIHGTTANPVGKAPFEGRITAKGKTLYLHVFARPKDGRITLPVAAAKAVLLDGGAAVELKSAGGSTTLMLPEKLPDPVVTVIRVD